DVLAARSRRSVGIDPQVLVLDLDVDVVIDFGIDPDAREARVPAGIGVIGADPDQSVNSTFRLEIAVRILALDQHGGGLDPRLLAGMVVDQLDLHSVAFAPTRIHALQHLGPILAFGSAGAGVDFDIGVVGVRLSSE